MAAIDVEGLLTEVSEDEPCGPDMEYEPLFQEMERAAAGKPAQEMGDSVTEAEEPDWRAVAKNAQGILAASKDIRAAVCLTRAAMHNQGLDGLASGLALVKELTERYWDHAHPQLDPDDDNDPTMRVNTLNALGDRDATVDGCRNIILVQAKGLGAYSLRHIDIAKGVTTLPEGFEGEVPNEATIDATFMQCELEELQQSAAHIDTCIENVDALNTFLAAKIGASETPDLALLTDNLNAMKAAVSEGLNRRGIATGDESDEQAGGDAAGPQQGISGTVQSREDVIRVIDQICEFYRRSEPSSPVPILLHRAKRLVNMDFMDIIRDMAPSGVSEAENLRGPSEEG